MLPQVCAQHLLLLLRSQSEWEDEDAVSPVIKAPDADRWTTEPDGTPSWLLMDDDVRRFERFTIGTPEPSTRPQSTSPVITDATRQATPVTAVGDAAEPSYSLGVGQQLRAVAQKRQGAGER